MGVKVLVIETGDQGVDEFFMATADRRGKWTDEKGLGCEPRCWSFCPDMPAADEALEDYVP